MLAAALAAVGIDLFPLPVTSEADFVTAAVPLPPPVTLLLASFNPAAPALVLSCWEILPVAVDAPDLNTEGFGVSWGCFTAWLPLNEEWTDDILLPVPTVDLAAPLPTADALLLIPPGTVLLVGRFGRGFTIVFATMISGDFGLILVSTFPSPTTSGDLPLLPLSATEQLDTTSGLLLAGEVSPLTPALSVFPRCKALLLTVAVTGAFAVLDTGFAELLLPEADVFADRLGGVGVRCKDGRAGWEGGAGVDVVLEGFVVTDVVFLSFLEASGDTAAERGPDATLATVFLLGKAGTAF